MQPVEQLDGCTCARPVASLDAGPTPSAAKQWRCSCYDLKLCQRKIATDAFRERKYWISQQYKGASVSPNRLGATQNANGL